MAPKLGDVRAVRRASVRPEQSQSELGDRNESRVFIEIAEFGFGLGMFFGLVAFLYLVFTLEELTRYWRLPLGAFGITMMYILLAELNTRCTTILGMLNPYSS
jgi:hypothetical protein